MDFPHRFKRLVGSEPKEGPLVTPEALAVHLEIVANSYRDWMGVDLVSPRSSATKLVSDLRDAPFALVSHGVEADPVLNYGNGKALELWEMTWEELTKTPSRLTAEAPNREERARLLDEVTRHGFIRNYSGIRVSKSGRRFRIEGATVWNLLDAQGGYCGQAAAFSRWVYL
ncbi:MAG: MEKHLA domain-containing protein [Deltaproteobacteria bacterium]|nr:MEKHLA domain-containing protein [Deltaproteobacteria bacterium]